MSEESNWPESRRGLWLLIEAWTCHWSKLGLCGQYGGGVPCFDKCINCSEFVYTHTQCCYRREFIYDDDDDDDRVWSWAGQRDHRCDHSFSSFSSPSL